MWWVWGRWRPSPDDILALVMVGVTERLEDELGELRSRGSRPVCMWDLL